MNKENENEEKPEDIEKVPEQEASTPQPSPEAGETPEQKETPEPKAEEASEQKETPEPKAEEASEQKETPEPKAEAQKEQSADNKGDEKEASKKDPRAGRKGNTGGKKAPFADESEESGIIEKVISINRITKVTKGGKKMSFSALVVVGDTEGNVGYSLSKAAEVATAIRKAMATAKKNMVKIPMRGTTIPHEIIGRCGGSRVLLKPASDGTGVIASGPVRAICDGAGIHNILTKCHRSNNPINVVKATIDGLTRLKSVEEEVKEVKEVKEVEEAEEVKE